MNDYEHSQLIDRLADQYSLPVALDRWNALRVFSLENRGGGVTFHRHETAWQAQVFGAKDWFLINPSIESVPLTSPCGFLAHGIPPIAERCRLSAGEVMFVPTGWWHATCSDSEEATIAIGGVGSTELWPAAHLAAKRGDAKVIGALSNVDSEKIPASTGVFSGGERPLFVAAAFGRTDLVAALLEKGANPNLARRDGRTPIHEAARRGDLGTVELLHKAGADLATADSTGSTVLHHACAERGHVETVNYLLSHGAGAHAQRNDGRTALHVACRGHVSPVALLRSLVQEGQSAPSSRDAEGMTPLMHCATAGHAQGVGLLLRFGGSEAARFVDKQFRDALDHAFVGRGDSGVVARLISGGLPLEGRGVQAGRLGEPAALSLLLDARADVSGACLEAARAGHVETIRVLLDHAQASTHELEEESGATPLHLATLGGHLGAVAMLVGAGANASVADADGLMPLHYVATIRGRVRADRRLEVAEALLQARASSQRSTGSEGLTPLHLAAASGDTELVRWLVLERNGADPAAQDSSGATPADAAAAANHTDLADFLKRAARVGDEL